ncbi:MOSC domain-containing protein [Halorubrum sp. AD140]|uniref:MOSC domain-containing protein n=1 Tax=Halorubrum sp. AD140 TaxID=3050073 RepID=UPI002ACD17B5|nr:MOSC domain-containing protein [Halorubrum sp. AD140]MDZ5812041.1 MOSC domain-containing protein [Halorubrum sp. AD140]
MTGRIEAVHVATEAGAPMEERERVEAVSGRGLRGDRYFLDRGTYSQSARDVSRELSLIEAETLDAVERDYGIAVGPDEHRRNLTTRGVGLNRLVGTRFRVGDAVCEGVELCEPCSYLESLLDREGLHDALVHRGGLRASIVEDGAIETGDSVLILGDAPDAARSRLEDA